MEPEFTCIWQFEVPAETDARFRRHYGPHGSWAALFGEDPAYIETVLLQDRAHPGRYLTIDRWRSEAAYRAFRQRLAARYDELDRACESLTRRETEVGAFAPVRDGQDA